MTELLLMCWEFFKAGLFAIGGGLVTLPFYNDMAAKYGWFTLQEIADMIAISDATPGPFGVNMATFAGSKAFGFIGALLSVVSLVLPSFVIIILVSKFLDKFSENRFVKASFTGLRPAVCALVLNAWYAIAKVSIFDPKAFSETGSLLSFFRPLPIILFILFFLGSHYLKKVPPIGWFGIGALCGLIFLL